MEKKDYLKPTIEIVEIQLSDCIAGSSIIVDEGKVKHVETLGTDLNWDSNGL